MGEPNILVGRGAVELVLIKKDKLEAYFVSEMDVYLWKRNCNAIVVDGAVYFDYVCDLPACVECDSWEHCFDPNLDKEELSSDLADAREFDCIAIDLDRLLEAAEAAEAAGSLEDWAVGAP